MDQETPSFLSIIENYKRLFTTIFSFFRKLNYRKYIFYVLLVAVVYYVLIFSAASILSQETFSTAAYDVGLYDQGIWLISRCLAPFTTIKGVYLFGDHAAFYSLLIAPLFWIWNNINFLYIFQTVLLALGAIPLFIYARAKLNSRFLALTIALSYLLFPALQNMNLENFHPEAASVFFVICTLYFLLKEEFNLFYPFAALSILGKEDIGITVAFVGLYLLFFKKNIRHGIITLIIGAGWYLLASRVIMPAFNGINIFSSQPMVYSYWFQGLAANLFNPNYYWSNFINPESIKYFFNLLLPLAFIPLLGFRVLVLALPALTINVLGGGYLRSIDFHYNYVVIAVVFFALIEGLYFINEKILKERRLGKDVVIILGAVILGFAFGSNNYLSQLPFNRHWTILKEKFHYLKSDAVKIRNEALKVIPGEARVSASYLLVTHLTHRKEIYMFPNPFRATYWNMWFREGKDIPSSEGRVDYIMADKTSHTGEDRLILNYLLNSSYYEEIYQNDPILILKHTDYKRVANLGANYILFDGKQKIKSKGIFSMLYFPDSNYYFRNLLGEEVLAEKRFALEMFGYLFIPENDQYKFEIQTDGQYLMEVDGKAAMATQNLSKGFHRYKIKYLNNNNRYGLKIILHPFRGQAYIIPDQHLRLIYSPQEFNDFMRKAKEKRREHEEFIRNLPNKVLNGGFESVMGDLPRDWRLECWQAENAICSYEVDSKYKVKGKYSANIEHRGKADSRWVQETEVKPNTNYKLSGWIKTVGVGGEGAGASIQIQDTAIKTEVLSGTRDWTYVEVEFKTGLEQKSVKVSCRLGDYGAINTGTAYFDDIIMKEIVSLDE